jgi:hypothetical protein
MDIEAIKLVIQNLSTTVNDLELSVIHAYDQFVVKYGVGHEHVSRLESYFPAIDKQREYITKLNECIEAKDFEKFHDVATKVRALSELVKNDAKCLLSYMSTGQHIEFQEEQMH